MDTVCEDWSVSIFLWRIGASMKKVGIWRQEIYHVNEALLYFSDAQLLDGPIILAPNEIKLEKGQNYTIRCKGKRPLQFKQQEMAEENLSNFTKIPRNVAPSDDEYGYEIALDMFDVDQYAVGYFACFDDQVNKSGVLVNLLEEPTNTEHISYTYVFVNGETSVWFTGLAT